MRRASTGEAAADALPVEAEELRFNLEFGCRDAASRDGISRSQVDSRCRCSLDALNSNLSRENWIDAAAASQAKDERRMAQSLAPGLKRVAESCREPEAVEVASGEAPALQALLLGKWAWTRKQNGCTEEYRFDGNGRAQILSGEEATEAEYRVEDQPKNSAARFALLWTTTADNGGKDCSGSNRSDVGRKVLNYVLVSYSRSMMVICESKRGMACFGPLRRIAEQP